ncbi:outer membrane protein assembly factor BamD [Fodinicurvata sp. EGI_FJ10296]|uniref:outer membrane protein assembly factor BamD n=1 Tax=Fodinicurvata sp. EGI_FJ10296 TaxID=3231908 RepID=UPI003452CAAD
MNRPVSRRSTSATARLAIAIALSVGLAACASSDEEAAYVERPPENIYAEAQDTLESGSYRTAAQLFDEVERQHPYSEWSTRSQIMAGFARYENRDYDEAIETLDRFIQLHPGHPNVDYAYYLKALSYYEQIVDVDRDQAMTQRAMDALEDLINRFPESEYARDAELKYDLTLDQLAGKEMTVGRYYLEQGHYNGAIGRFRTVIEDYDTTTHVPEALHRLVEAFLALGLREQARVSASVLGYNYPGSDWYIDSYALLVDEGVRPPDERGFVERTLDAIF